MGGAETEQNVEWRVLMDIAVAVVNMRMGLFHQDVFLMNVAII
jgi:hypothetical protein